MPDYDDRKELQGESKEQATHYSKTLDRNSLYGEGKVYINREIAHEKIVLIIQNDIEVLWGHFYVGISFLFGAFN